MIIRHRLELNLRDFDKISGDVIPKGMFLRSGKLCILTPKECSELCRKYNIQCVIDLRTPIEAAEFPDPLPEGVKYLQIPLLKDATVGITHETGSDPMTILRNLRKHPEKLLAMLPDFKALYKEVVAWYLIVEYAFRNLQFRRLLAHGIEECSQLFAGFGRYHVLKIEGGDGDDNREEEYRAENAHQRNACGFHGQEFQAFAHITECDECCQ